MAYLDWENIRKLAHRKTTLYTKTKIPFQVLDVSENMVYIRVRSQQEHTISRSNLELAVKKIQAGVVLNGPQDYRNLIADDRPAYAWAILKHLGYI